MIKKKLLENLETEGIGSSKVLDAIKKVPRENFVPHSLINSSYENKALPIEKNQTISQPFIVAYMTEKLKLMDLDSDFSKRGINDGFSGGEKKRFEIIQMLMLNPDLVILDETDSGLDIDALKIVANGINNFRTKNKSFILITHYHRIVQYLSPDYVHIMLDGTIVKSGTEQLAIDLENKGYDWLKK